MSRAYSYVIKDSKQEHIVVLDKIMSVHREGKTVRIIFVGPRSEDYNMETHDDAITAYKMLERLLQ